jgi:hypothetical protein
VSIKCGSNVKTLTNAGKSGYTGSQVDHQRRDISPAHFRNNTKSATTSRAWSRPLRGAIPIPPALLVVADSCMNQYWKRSIKLNFWNKEGIRIEVWDGKQTAFRCLKLQLFRLIFIWCDVIVELPDDPTSYHKERISCRMNTVYDTAKQMAVIAIKEMM